MTLLCSQTLAISLASYNSQQLTTGYSLYWKVENAVLHLALQTDSSGWVGVGIPEEVAGSMPGADIVTCQLDELGQPSVLDKHAFSFSMPPEDDCQDWLLDDFTDENSVKTYYIHRNLVTEDSQDRPVPENSSRVLWARGGSTWSYHTER